MDIRDDKRPHELSYKCIPASAWSCLGDERRTEPGTVVDLEGPTWFILSFPDILHGVEAWFRPSGELRGPESPVGEGAAGEGAVDYLDFFALGVEDDDDARRRRPRHEGREPRSHPLSRG